MLPARILNAYRMKQFLTANHGHVQPTSVYGHGDVERWKFYQDPCTHEYTLQLVVYENPNFISISEILLLIIVL